MGHYFLDIYIVKYICLYLRKCQVRCPHGGAERQRREEGHARGRPHARLHVSSGLLYGQKVLTHSI